MAKNLLQAVNIPFVEHPLSREGVAQVVKADPGQTRSLEAVLENLLTDPRRRGVHLPDLIGKDQGKRILMPPAPQDGQKRIQNGDRANAVVLRGLIETPPDGDGSPLQVNIGPMETKELSCPAPGVKSRGIERKGHWSLLPSRIQQPFHFLQSH